MGEGGGGGGESLEHKISLCGVVVWIPDHSLFVFCLGTEVPRHSAGCVGTYVVRTSLFAMCPRKCCMHPYQTYL